MTRITNWQLSAFELKPWQALLRLADMRYLYINRQAPPERQVLLCASHSWTQRCDHYIREAEPCLALRFWSIAQGAVTLTILCARRQRRQGSYLAP